jgi:thiol-disulfide isomerase/thioredoxin
VDQPRELLSVILLTRTGCGLCEQAAAVLERLADEYPLSVVALDFDAAAGQALAQQSGVLYVPGIVIDGAAVMEGRISAKNLRREIERRVGPRTAEGAPGMKTPADAEGRGRMWRSILGWISRD